MITKTRGGTRSSGSPYIHRIRSLRRAPHTRVAGLITVLSLAGFATWLAFTPAEITNAGDVSVLAAVSILPAVLFALYVAYDGTGAWKLGAAVLAGGALVAVAFVVNTAAIAILVDNGVGILGILAASSLSEEALKLGVALVIVYLVGVRTPVEAAAYGGLVGLGFAAAENTFYLLTLDGGAALAVQRAGVAPMHVLVTATAVGLYHLIRRRKRAYYTVVPAMVLALAVAATLHLVYNLSALGQLSLASGETGRFATVAVFYVGTAVVYETVGRDGRREDMGRVQPDTRRAQPHPSTQPLPEPDGSRTLGSESELPPSDAEPVPLDEAGSPIPRVRIPLSEPDAVHHADCHLPSIEPSIPSDGARLLEA